METIVDILKNAISTQLMAESLPELAEKLGYKGRSTLYRVMKGNASERAVEGLCQKLSSHWMIDEDDLRQMNTTINNSRMLGQIVKKYLKPEVKNEAYRVVAAFVYDNYEIFTSEFHENELNSLRQLRRSNREAYFTMLAYYYYKHSDVTYYEKGLTHRQRSAKILESLGDPFYDIQPENNLGLFLAGIYTNSGMVDCEPPILWSLITSLALMLTCYGQPIDFIKHDVKTHLIDGLHKRDYWRSSDKDCYILTFAYIPTGSEIVEHKIFAVNKSDGHIEYIGNMGFVSDCVLSLYSTRLNRLDIGYYEWNGESLNFQWDEGKADPWGYGNRWTLADMRTSESLRQLDRLISDEQLYDVMSKALGLKEVEGYKVRDVLISRELLMLKLNNGRTLAINRSAASFFSQISPDDLVKIYEDIEDGEKFVYWPGLMHGLPLEQFAMHDA